MLYHEKRAKRKGHRFIAGVDEAGRGPWAGPVVAASVILGKIKFVQRIDDSKRLSPGQRKKAFPEIVRSSLVGIGIVDNTKIDEINILNATRCAMEGSIMALGVSPDLLLVDGNVKIGLPLKRKNIIKGDSKSLSIAAASIVAKVVRDSYMREFDKQYPVYGFFSHKGYGTRRHRTSLKHYGPCPIHRKTFKPVKQVVVSQK